MIVTAATAARPDEVVLITGSLPPSAPDALFATLLKEFESHSVVVDAGGVALASCLPLGPYLVKPNFAEAQEYGADAARAAEGLVAAGARYGLVTVGADGAFLAGDAGTHRLIAPAVAATNPTGSGDAFAAGILTGLESGESLRDALRLGVAAAADNATRCTAGRVDRDAVLVLKAQVQIMPC